MILMYLGNMALSENRFSEAEEYYKELLKVDRKYFEAYIALAGLVSKTDIEGARTLLRKCLIINPQYKQAIIALADTYRYSDPDIAEKYYDLARSVD